MMLVLFSPRLSFFRGSQRGMTMVELLVTISILAVMIAVAVPKLNKSVLDLPVTEQNLMGDIRLARANATSRGVHFRVSVSTSSYSVQRLQDNNNDGVWEPDSGFPAQVTEMPPGISLSLADGSSSVLEFTTRGLLADNSDGTPAGIVTIYIHKTLDGDETKTVEIWPSGQVEEV